MCVFVRHRGREATYHWLTLLHTETEYSIVWGLYVKSTKKNVTEIWLKCREQRREEPSADGYDIHVIFNILTDGRDSDCRRDWGVEMHLCANLCEKERINMGLNCFQVCPMWGVPWWGSKTDSDFSVSQHRVTLCECWICFYTETRSEFFTRHHGW